MMRVGILQPAYLPWLGFFDLLARCDRFILFDDVQFTLRDWRTRNRIRTPQGWQWLSVPVSHTAPHMKIPILEVRVDDSQDWRAKHLASIRANYGKSAHFNDVYPRVEAAMTVPGDRLVELNERFIRLIADWLGVRTDHILRSSELAVEEVDPTRRLIRLCQAARAVGAASAATDTLVYESGPAAKDYLDERAFGDEGIRVEWQAYQPPTYTQRFAKQSATFITHLSALDLVMNHGRDGAEIFAGRRTVALADGVRAEPPA